MKILKEKFIFSPFFSFLDYKYLIYNGEQKNPKAMLEMNTFSTCHAFWKKQLSFHMIKEKEIKIIN